MFKQIQHNVICITAQYHYFGKKKIYVDCTLCIKTRLLLKYGSVTL